MYILILMMHVGPMWTGDSNALTSVPNFETEQACLEAGNKAKKMDVGTVKKILFVCVKNK